jgi:hypothetical protein
MQMSHLRNPIRSAAFHVAALFVLAVPMAGTSIAATQVFSYTGAAQTFTVPAGVTSINIIARGAQGGLSQGQFPGGKGAEMAGDFVVTPGANLGVIVGGQGNPDVSTSGGGGGSGVNNAGTPLIVAGGGAGVDFQDPNFGGKDAVTTNNGVTGNGGGGAGGTAGSDGADTIYVAVNFARGGRGWTFGNNGSLGQNGVSANTTTTNGTFGLGGGGGSVGNGFCNCSGGGGGYSGGGAGGINRTGGGGGSLNSGTNQVNIAGSNTGNGLVIITYAGALPVVAVPTTDAWVLALLGLVLFGFAAVAVRRTNGLAAGGKR